MKWPHLSSPKTKLCPLNPSVCVIADSMTVVPNRLSLPKSSFSCPSFYSKTRHVEE